MDELGGPDNNADTEHNAGNISKVIKKTDVKLDVSGLGGANNTNIKYDTGELNGAKNNTDIDLNANELGRANKIVDREYDAGGLGRANKTIDIEYNVSGINNTSDINVVNNTEKKVKICEFNLF